MNRLTKHIEEWIEGKSYEDLVNELVDLKVHGENTQENKTLDSKDSTTTI